MANNLKTMTMLTRKALSVLHNELVFCRNINRQYDSSFAKTGAKIGSSLQIRKPNQFSVRTGAVMNLQDVVEDTITLTLATQAGVDFSFTSEELTMILDDPDSRILQPAMSRLAAEIEKTVIDNVYKEVYNLVGTPGTTPASLLTALDARVKLSKGLAPKDSERYLLYDSLAHAKTVDALKGLFQSASEIEKQYEKGYMGVSGGFKWLEGEIIPSLTNGSRDDTTPVVNTSTGIVSGTASIAITGEDASVTIKAGEIFTIAGVFAVNPETKVPYTHLQQFVVTADATADGAGAVTVSVSPTPITSGAKQNISIVGAGAGKAVVHVGAGGSGAKDTAYPQFLAWHRDAFTFVTADLVLPPGDVAAREQSDGISMRVWRQGDIVNDKIPTRIDVLFGSKCIRPEWACRITG